MGSHCTEAAELLYHYIDGELTEERLAQVRSLAETLLSNPVIEDYTVQVTEATA